jgi:hypothetical protein
MVSKTRVIVGHYVVVMRDGEGQAPVCEKVTDGRSGKPMAFSVEPVADADESEESGGSPDSPQSEGLV